MMRVLEREQWLPISLDEAWDFFGSPRNLAKITPNDMGFVIRGAAKDAPVHAGQTIYIPPHATQYIKNTGQTDLKFLCMVDPAWRAEDEEILS